ncbi:unnamed protein product [marine sediment metagenome]|uniref:Uncharacterized protein n=1 Tax=marine sediment metagenome TaxID=412755 RepID=X0WII9_9ZZZZ
MDYLNEILIGVGSALVLSIITAVRTFFQQIKQMKIRLTKLEADVRANKQSDKKIEEIVMRMIHKKL